MAVELVTISILRRAAESNNRIAFEHTVNHTTINEATI
jgi:hypothetical protein